jgi:hypothetical protein
MDDLVKGGQGRTTEDIEDSAMLLAVGVVITIIAIIIPAVVGLLAGGLF